VKRKDSEIIARRQEEKRHRLDRRRQPETDAPILGKALIRYEMPERLAGVVQGGIGMVTQLVKHLGLAEAIDRRLDLLSRHQPYHESDHVMSLVLNIVAGGRCVEDLKARRQDVGFLDSLGAERIPDATTAGDFLRRFDEADVVELMEAGNDARLKAWHSLPKADRRLAMIDVDGTIVPTLGNQKEGADFSYNGKWGYGPLVISLANTQEVLYVVNRSASRPSHDGAVEWLDEAVGLALEGGFKRARLRGDTDFSLTANFDRWSDAGVEFVFGIDANKAFVDRAKSLPQGQWRRLRRKGREGRSRGTGACVPRLAGRDFREQKVFERGFTNYRLQEEHYAEMTYRPRKARHSCRMIVLRKRINVSQGQQRLEDEIRYHFYVTNVAVRRLRAKDAIFESNARCHQENLIEQLKNGVRATQMPSGGFMANWAYMAIGSLAWNLKIWLALTLPSSAQTKELLRMEYRRFVNEVVTFAAQVVRTGRYLVFRPMGVNEWTAFVLEASAWFGKAQRKYA